MRILISLGLLMFHQLAFSQKIDYSIPQGYEKIITSAEYKKLVDLSLAEVSKRYKVKGMQDGTVQLQKKQNMSAFNLHNLITKCAAENDRSKWGKVIQEHFGNLFAAFDEQKKIDPNNFETVRKYLSLRVYPASLVQERGGEGSFMFRKHLEGTYTMLMLDLPGSFMGVEKSVFELWKMNTDTVFNIAQRNINSQVVEKVTHMLDVDGGKIEMFLLGNEDYAASYALDLENNAPEMVGEWGAVVAIPNKGLVDVCKITKARSVDFVKFIQYVKPVVQQYYEGHQQPVSNQFFWYYQGKFTPIKVVEENGKINVIAPMGLSELMSAKQ